MLDNGALLTTLTLDDASATYRTTALSPGISHVLTATYGGDSNFLSTTASVGSSNLYNSGSVTATTETVTGLPSNGETVYVRLYWLLNGAWQYTNYTYKAF